MEERAAESRQDMAMTTTLITEGRISRMVKDLHLSRKLTMLRLLLPRENDQLQIDYIM